MANWFGWFNRALEASADPQHVPMLWRRYAFHGYLILQRVDGRVLEPLLPPELFYNLLLAARKADECISSGRRDCAVEVSPPR